MITITSKQAVTVVGDQVVGYVRIGDDDPLRLEALADEIRAFAVQHALVLGTVFTERYGTRSALKRPALRTMLDVVRYLHPSGLVVPTTWHLSGIESELASLLRLLAELNCRVFTTQPGKAAVAVRPTERRSGQR
jgi:DNA invertase Pin-like site-specific DNA recombinase